MGSSAEPGDLLHLRGPSGAYAPDPTADWHLFVGDEAGLPAISAALEALPVGAQAVAFVEVGGVADEIAIATLGELEMHWLHRGDAPAGTTTLLDDAVRAWDWRAGRAQAFIHGESALLKSVRPYVLNDRGVARADARYRPTGGAARPRRVPRVEVGAEGSGHATGLVIGTDRIVSRTSSLIG